VTPDTCCRLTELTALVRGLSLVYLFKMKLYTQRSTTDIDERWSARWCIVYQTRNCDVAGSTIIHSTATSLEQVAQANSAFYPWQNEQNE